MPELEDKVLTWQDALQVLKWQRIKATMGIYKYTSPVENMTYLAFKVSGIQKVLLKREKLWRTLDAMYSMYAALQVCGKANSTSGRLE